MSNEKLYAERDPEALDEAGDFYWRHVSAMTTEDLRSKSSIAAELGYRDMQIAALESRNAELLAALVEARESVADWALYASEYFQEKHDLAGELSKFDAVIERNSK